MKIKNIRKLAKFLKTIPQEKFDMGYFRANRQGMCNFVSENKCGTVGCALGWAPLVPGLGPKREHFSSGTLKFLEYCYDMFEIDEEFFRYLFSESWGDFDNTPLGASNRIYNLCKLVQKHGEYKIEVVVPDETGDEDCTPPYKLVVNL